MEEALIKVKDLSENVVTAISLLENGEKSLICVKDGENVACQFARIYYIEANDDRTFVYTKDECMEVRSRLYELEEVLDGRFFRCSKSMICNVRKIKGVKAQDNSRMAATLLNDEKIIITRSYVKELKKRLGI